jgi:UPF0716 family protein affecting phage T7 exclusion
MAEPYAAFAQSFSMTAALAFLVPGILSDFMLLLFVATA